MRLLWQKTTMTRRGGRTPWLSQQQYPHPSVLSTCKSYTRCSQSRTCGRCDLTPTALGTAQPLAPNVESGVTHTTGRTCAAPGHHLDHIQKKRQLTMGQELIQSNCRGGRNQYKKGQQYHIVQKKTPLIVDNTGNNKRKTHSTINLSWKPCTWT